MNFDLDFSSPALYPILLAGIGVLLALVIYRHTVPPVSSWMRRILAAARAIALAGVLLLLFEPVFTLGHQRERKPAVAVLIDRSASMTLSDSVQQRAEIAKALLDSPWMHSLGETAELQYFSFSDSLKALPADAIGQLQFAGDGSALALALKSAQEQLTGQNFAGAVLLTDGTYNLGENPLRVADQYGVPLIIPQIGASRSLRDIRIDEVATNEIAYTDTELPIAVTLSATGFSGRRASIQVIENSIPITKREITLPGDNTQLATDFKVLPQNVGLNRYVIQVDSLDGEATSNNNRRVAYVRVLKSKVQLRILAGAPSPDFAFLQRRLTSDSNFEVEGFVQKTDGSFYSTGNMKPQSLDKSEAWHGVDGVILVDFPRRSTDDAVLAAMASQLNESGMALLYLHGPSVDLDKLWMLRNSLPLSALPVVAPEQLMSLQLTPAGRGHAITRPMVENKNNEQTPKTTALQDELPPLFFNLRNVSVLPGSEVLAVADMSSGPAQTRSSTSQPVWLVQRLAARKTVMLLTYGLWRWHMLLQAGERPSELYDQIVRGIVRWMVTTDDSKLVSVTSNKEIYRGGEQIELLAQVYYEDYRPLENARVTVAMTGPKFNQEIMLQDVGNGLYRANLQVLAGGEYSFRGSAEQEGRKIGEDNGKFSVEPFSLEFLSTMINEPLLRELASATNGVYGPPEKINDFVANLNLQPITTFESHSTALWGQPLVLTVLILALALEWFIRRRQGML